MNGRWQADPRVKRRSLGIYHVRQAQTFPGRLGSRSKESRLKRRAGDVGSIDAYIATHPPAVRSVLRRIRATVRTAAPDASELISYRMPAFAQDGILIYFAAFKNHIGMFPPVSGDPRLERSLSRYMGPKGNLRFPLDEPLPFHLIRRIVTLRLRQNVAKAAARRRRR